MTAPPLPIVAAPVAEGRTHRNRWAILAVLCLTVLVVVLDGTIVNVTLPTLATELGATTSQLQWIVDSYVLVFAGLLMAAGSIGDRFGRKGVMQVGLALFGGFSALAALSDSPEALIGWRAAMGIGAALLFPATLAILVNVFTEAKERAVAISMWAATAGIAVALGPVSGGFLLEHFWWGSVLMINVPIVVVAIVAIARIVPTSRDTTIHRFDPLGTVTVDRGDRRARLGRDRRSRARLGLDDEPRRLRSRRRPDRRIRRVGASHRSSDARRAGLHEHALHRRQRRRDVRLLRPVRLRLRGDPVLPVRARLRHPRSRGAHAAVRRVHRDDGAAVGDARQPLRHQDRGRCRPSVDGTRLHDRRGHRGVRHAVRIIVVAMFFMGGGLGLVQAPATESIMGSLPPEKAGVGSAVNDTTRELGGTLGVAIVGSVFASIYSSKLGDALSGTPVPAEAVAIAKESVGAAQVVAERATVQAGPEAEAFIDRRHRRRLPRRLARRLVGVGRRGARRRRARLRFLPARSAARRGARTPRLPTPRYALANADEFAVADDRGDER